MLKSNQNITETLQNQSNTTENQSSSYHKFTDYCEFDASHTIPSGKFFIVKPDIDTSWMHTHNFLEIGRCVSGSGTFNIQNKIYSIKSPCYSIVYQGEYHSAQSNPYDMSEWHFLYLDLNYFVSKLDATIHPALKGLNWDNYEFKHIFDSANPQITMLIDRIITLSASNEENKLELLTSYICSLLLEHARLMKKTEKKFGQQKIVDRIAPAISYISANYKEEITMEQLAKLCFLSVATLRRDFIEYFGISPNEYLHKVRIKNATIMLTTSNRGILEIAMNVGYSTVSCFNRQFNKYHKISPREYRAKHKQ